MWRHYSLACTVTISSEWNQIWMQRKLWFWLWVLKTNWSEWAQEMPSTYIWDQCHSSQNNRFHSCNLQMCYLHGCRWECRVICGLSPGISRNFANCFDGFIWEYNLKNWEDGNNDGSGHFADKFFIEANIRYESKWRELMSNLHINNYFMRPELFIFEITTTSTKSRLV